MTLLPQQKEARKPVSSARRPWERHVFSGTPILAFMESETNSILSLQPKTSLPEAEVKPAYKQQYILMAHEWQSTGKVSCYGLNRRPAFSTIVIASL